MELDLCRDLQDAYPEFVAGLVDPSVSLRIQVHLADGCAPCAQELSDLCDAFHGIIWAQPAVPLPDAVLEALSSEIPSEAQERPEAVIVYPATRERPLLWTLVGLCFLMVVAVAWWGRGQDRVRRDAVTDREIAIVQTQRVLDDYRRLQELVDDLTSPRVGIFDLPPSPGVDSGPRARVFVNSEQRRITLRAVGMAPPGDEQIHAAWLRSGVDEVLLGVLPPALVVRGAGVRLDLPEAARLPGRLILSLESWSGADPGSRSGPVLLEGDVGNDPSEDAQVVPAAP